MGQQFFEGQAQLRPVPAFGQFLDVGIRRRPVQVADRLVERAKLVVAGQFRRQPVGQAAGAEHGQGLLAQLAQALLGEALGSRVDRRQGLLHRNRLVAVQRAVFRMVDLQARGTRPDFAVAAQVGAALETVLLRLAEMVEAQAQGAAAVLQAHQQAAAAPHHHVGAGHHALDHRVGPWPQGADGGDAGTVLVAQGQVEQDILQGFQAYPSELLRQRGAYAL